MKPVVGDRQLLGLLTALTEIFFSNAFHALRAMPKVHCCTRAVPASPSSVYTAMFHCQDYPPNFCDKGCIHIHLLDEYF